MYDFGLLNIFKTYAVLNCYNYVSKKCYNYIPQPLSFIYFKDFSFIKSIIKP